VIPIDIQQLVDYLESIVGRGVKLPGGKVMLSHNELDNLIDQLRIAIPLEMQQAKEILANRENLLSRAQDESQRNPYQTKSPAVQRVDDHLIVREAEEKAHAVLKEAREEALQITNGADEYAEESLRQLAGSIVQLNAVIQNGLHALARRRSQRTQKNTPEVSSSAGPVVLPTSDLASTGQ
jgi:hypothetical protein